MYGDSNMTAMCKTVGYTAAVGAEMVLDGNVIPENGIIVPMTKNIYMKGLELLEAEDLIFKESVRVHKL